MFDVSSLRTNTISKSFAPLINSHVDSRCSRPHQTSVSLCKVAGSSPLAAGCRVATVGQLLFAPWAWAYSTLHPLGVGK